MLTMHPAAQTPPGGEWDIRYEVALVGQLAARWTETFRDKKIAPGDYEPGTAMCMDYNSCLESTLVHARNVLEFLMLAKDPGTRSAVQFAPGWDPDAVKARHGQLYGDLCGFLSHIAVRRPSPPPEWAVVDVADLIVQEYEAFLRSVTQGNARFLNEGAAIARS
jgi:hypothetical protein